MKKLRFLLIIMFLCCAIPNVSGQQKKTNPKIKKEFKHPDRIKYDGAEIRTR